MESALHPSAPLRVGGETVLASGFRALWFLFKDAAWDIARVYTPDGRWTGYYVDALDPIWWSGDDPHTLRPLVDLYLDLWITPDCTVTRLDLDELESALQRGDIDPERADAARSTMDELVRRTEAGTFPPAEVRMWPA